MKFASALVMTTALAMTVAMVMAMAMVMMMPMLKMGAWIFADNRDNRPQNTCVSSNKLSFFFYLKVKLFDIFVILKVMLFFCQKAESVRNTKCPISTLPAKIIAFACLCLSFW